ncbi:MAG TPA: contractile injection system tape measure protein [Rhizobacter sp.]|nr:contractile injection system tape measure protein [Rhizobacter sp.]
MTETHLVDDLQFQFTVADAAEGDPSPRLAAWSRDAALRIIDEVFSEVSPPGEVLSLQRLEINLGSVNGEDAESQWAARLREQLMWALRDRRSAAKKQEAAQPTDDRFRTPAQSDLAVFLHYLQRGHLPWSVVCLGPGELDALANRVLRGNGAALREALQQVPVPAPWLRRMAKQFSEAWLAELAALLTEGRADEAVRQVRALSPAKRAAAWVGLFQRSLGEPLRSRTPPPAQAEPSTKLRTGPAEAPPSHAEEVLEPTALLSSTLSALIDHLSTGTALDADTLSTLKQSSPSALLSPAGATQALQCCLASPQAADRLAALWPASQVAPWLRSLCGMPAETVHASIALMSQACRATGLSAAIAQIERLSWRHALRELFEERREVDPGEFAHRLTEHLAERLQAPEPQRWRTQLAQALREMAAQQPMAEALAHALVPPPPTTPAQAPASPEPAPAWAEGDALEVSNAGLALVGPYLPRLWGMLKLTHEGAFIDEAAATRAVQLLQFIVTGRSETPEHALVLNKLLCGLPLEAPVAREIALREDEQAAIEGMLQAVIEHWKGLGKTSVPGLRETFLQRPARLSYHEEGWRLQVAQRPFDMLLDQLPWGYATLKFAWMEGVIHVDWR